MACSPTRKRDLQALVFGVLVLLLCGFAPQVVRAGSDVPPEGPPWVTDLLEAQEQALKEGRPVFLYFTKTY